MTQELTIKSQNSDRKIADRREDSNSNLNLKAASEIETESQTDRFFYLRSETFLCRLCKTVSRLNRKICFVWLLPVQSLPQLKSTDSSEKTCDANDTEPLKTKTWSPLVWLRSTWPKNKKTNNEFLRASLNLTELNKASWRNVLPGGFDYFLSFCRSSCFSINLPPFVTC